MNAGISFSPFGQQGGSNQNGSQARPQGPQAPVQDAIRLLSLKLPSNVGPTAPSGMLGGPTPLGPQLGNAIADNWLQGLYQPQQGRTARLGVPAYQQTMDQGGGQNMGAIFAQLMQQLGVPSLTGQAPPSAMHAAVHFSPDDDLLDSLMGGMGGAAPADAQAQNLAGRTSEGAGGWTGGGQTGFSLGSGFNERGMQTPSASPGQTSGFGAAPMGGFGGFDFQQPF